MSLDDSYAEDRYRVNEVARANLQHLLTLVISLPNLPQSIRELLLSHSERLYNSIPQGPGALARGVASDFVRESITREYLLVPSG